MVHEAAGRHRAQTEFNQGCVVGEQQGQRFGMREFRCAAEAAVAGIEALAKLHDGARHERRFEAGRFILGAGQLRVERGAHVVLEVRHLAAAFAIGLRHPLQHIGKPRPAVTRRIGEIGAAEIRHLVVGRQEHGQRPAAVGLGQQLVRGLVDLVEVRALFAVDLDVDEQAVHERGDVGVLE